MDQQVVLSNIFYFLNTSNDVALGALLLSTDIMNSSNDYNHFRGMIYLPLLSIPVIVVCIRKGQHNSIQIQSFIAEDQVEYIWKNRQPVDMPSRKNYVLP